MDPESPVGDCPNVVRGKRIEVDRSTLPRRSKKKKAKRRLSNVDSVALQTAIKSSNAVTGSLDNLTNAVGTTKPIRRKDLEQIHARVKLWLLKSSQTVDEESALSVLHELENYAPSSDQLSPASSLEPFPSSSPPLSLLSVNTDAPPIPEDSELLYDGNNRLPTLSRCECCVKPEPQADWQKLVVTLLQGANLSSFHHSPSSPTLDSPLSSAQSETLPLSSSGNSPTSLLSYLQHSERELCDTHRHDSQELVMVKCCIPCVGDAQAVFPPLGLYTEADSDLCAVLSSLCSDYTLESAIH